MSSWEFIMNVWIIWIIADGHQGQQAFNAISSSLEGDFTSSWPFAWRQQQELKGSWSCFPRVLELLPSLAEKSMLLLHGHEAALQIQTLKRRCSQYCCRALTGRRRSQFKQSGKWWLCIWIWQCEWRSRLGVSSAGWSFITEGSAKDWVTV